MANVIETVRHQAFEYLGGACKNLSRERFDKAFDEVVKRIGADNIKSKPHDLIRDIVNELDKERNTIGSLYKDYKVAGLSKKHADFIKSQSLKNKKAPELAVPKITGSYIELKSFLDYLESYAKSKQVEFKRDDMMKYLKTSKSMMTFFKDRNSDTNLLHNSCLWLIHDLVRA